MQDIDLYISTGIIESCEMGLARVDERLEYEARCLVYPELRKARDEFRDRLEQYAIDQAVPAPPEVKERVMKALHERFPDDRSFILYQVLMQPDLMDHLSSRQFEELVADLFIRMGYGATLTAATRDGGKDIIVVRHLEVGELTCVVECKRWSSGRKVGEAVLRELYGVMEYHRATMGILVTSSGFSADAVRFQEKVRHRLTLIDRAGLMKWIDSING